MFFDDLPRFWNGAPLNGESENDGCDVLQKKSGFEEINTFFLVKTMPSAPSPSHHCNIGGVYIYIYTIPRKMGGFYMALFSH